MENIYTSAEIIRALDDTARHLGPAFTLEHEVGLRVSPETVEIVKTILRALPEPALDPKWPDNIMDLLTRLEEAAGTYGKTAQWLEPLVRVVESGADVQLAKELMYTLSERLTRTEATFDDISMEDQQVVVYFNEGRGSVRGKPSWDEDNVITLNVGGKSFRISREDYLAGKYKVYLTPKEAPDPSSVPFIKNVRVRESGEFDYGVSNDELYLVYSDNTYRGTVSKDEIIGWEPAVMN